MKVLSFAVLSAVLVFTARAGVWYVAPTGDDGNAGSSEKPFATINCAIASAAEGDEIRIQAGTYVENVRNVAAEGGKNGLQFRGGYAADWTRDLKTQKTIVKAADAAQTVFYVNTKTNLLNGLTLTGGKVNNAQIQNASTDSGLDVYIGNCMYRDARLNADYSLADDSHCLKRGADQSSNDTSNLTMGRFGGSLVAGWGRHECLQFY